MFPSEPSQQELRILQKLKDEQEERKALRLHYFPDPILNLPCAPVEAVTDEIRNFVKDMILTMMLKKGVGLAAPQVGWSLRIFVADVEYSRNIKRAEPLVFINPSILAIGDERVDSREGCLSFPAAVVHVPRDASVLVSAQGFDGERFELRCEGLLARVVQHENDHLNGVTINGHLTSVQRHLMRKDIKKLR